MSGQRPQRDFQVRLIELLHAASIEIAAKPAVVETLKAAFDPGTEIFVNLPPAGDYRACVETAVAIRRAGFRPVAHVAARNLASLAELDDYLERLAGEAGADRVLLISGDRPQPRGPFSSVLDVLASGRVSAAGITTIGVAGHPEGHPAVAPAVLDAALVAKRDAAADAGLSCFIVTQFCFEAAPIISYLARLDRLGLALPVKVGVAAPASVPTLIRYALRCGVGDSLRALSTQAKTVGRLIGESGPEDLLHDLAVGLSQAASDRVAGIHLYPFGGVAKAADWIEVTLARLYQAITTRAAGG
jgi:methylenetetrahydrofolate reductase (NADPH)